MGLRFFRLSEEDVVMTTWHADDTLSDAVEFAVLTAWPTDGYLAHCSSVVAIIVGDDTLADEVRRHLSRFCVSEAAT